MGIDSDYPSFLATSSEPKYLMYENEESFKFQLNIPDNSVPLYAVSKAMRGCFLDSNLLKKTVSTYSRRVSPTSPFASDQYFIKDGKMLCNGTQYFCYLHAVHDIQLEKSPHLHTLN